MSKIIMSAFADEYATPFEEQLAGMRDFGIKYIELRHADGINVSALTPEQIQNVKALLDKYGIGVSAIGSPLGKIKLDEDMNAHLETAKTVFEAARTLGAKYVRVFSFYAPEGKKITDMRDEVFAGMEALLKLAREYGVTLCHENEALIYGDVPERCRELLDHFGGELKCVFDMGNFHIKDSLAAGAIVPPGKGEASIKEILAAYEAEFSRDFFVSLEPHLQLFDGKNALVGRAFENPYQYADAKEAFADAVKKFLELTAK